MPGKPCSERKLELRPPGVVRAPRCDTDLSLTVSESAIPYYYYYYDADLLEVWTYVER